MNHDTIHMSSDTIHIAFCTDTNYVMPTGVAMISVCENNREESICFHLVITDEGTSPDEVATKVQPLKDIAERYGKEAKVYSLKSENLKDFICSGAGYISTTAFARIFLPELLDESIHKVLYLDCDIAVDGSLRELWETSLSDACPLAAAIDANSCTQYCHFSNKDHVATTYYNSGVLLINLECWRQENLIQKTVDCAIRFKFSLLDQDVLNYLYCDRIKEIEPTYNFQILYDFKGSNSVPVDYIPLIDSCREHPIIVHYITANKPWKDEYCPRREVWEKYLNLSQWRGITYTPVVTRLDRTEIYKDLLDTYWSDPKVFQQSVGPFLRLFKAAIRLKNKAKILRLSMSPISWIASFLEKVYQYKTRNNNR